jgi:hypothetical protein
MFGTVMGTLNKILFRKVECLANELILFVTSQESGINIPGLNVFCELNYTNHGRKETKNFVVRG